MIKSVWLLAFLLLLTSEAFGQTQSKISTEELIAKIQLLENRVKQLEASKAAPSTAGSASTKEPSNSPGWTTMLRSRGQQAPVQIVTPRGPPPGTITVEDARKQTARAVSNERLKAKQKRSGPTPEQKKKRNLQASFIYRDTVPTLAKNKFEVSANVTYTRAEGPLQSDRLVLGSASVRYGFAEGWEIAAVLPMYMTTRATRLAATSILTNEVKGLGDASVQVSKVIRKPSVWIPGISMAVGLTLPTGISPFDFRGFTNPVNEPRNPFESIQSLGHWAISNQWTFFKTYDPLIIFASAGIEYAFGKQIDGFDVQPGKRFTYSMGMSIAYSENTTLGFLLLGQYREALAINGEKVFNGASEQWQAKATVIQRLDLDLYMEPHLTVGLTDNAPDVAVGVGLRKRF